MKKSFAFELLQIKILKLTLRPFHFYAIFFFRNKLTGLLPNDTYIEQYFVLLSTFSIVLICYHRIISFQIVKKRNWSYFNVNPSS